MAQSSERRRIRATVSLEERPDLLGRIDEVRARADQVLLEPGIGARPHVPDPGQLPELDLGPGGAGGMDQERRRLRGALTVRRARPTLANLRLLRASISLHPPLEFPLHRAVVNPDAGEQERLPDPAVIQGLGVV